MEIKMESLKVGDKLYQKQYKSWGRGITYNFATVERLTRTQAILSNGVRLINNGKMSCGERGYSVYGDIWSMWHIETEEILLEFELEQERKKIDSWFSNRKFSDEEKKIIYMKFEELGLLKPISIDDN